MSIGADLEAGLGVGIWDTVWDIGSGSVGASFSVPLDSIGLVGTTVIQEFFDFAIESSARFQQLLAFAVNPPIGEQLEQLADITADLASILQTSVEEVLTSILSLVGETEMEISFSIDAAGESSSGSSSSGDSGGDGEGNEPDDTINLLDASITLPIGATAVNAFKTAPEYIIKTFELVATYLSLLIDNARGIGQLRIIDTGEVTEHLKSVAQYLWDQAIEFISGCEIELQSINVLGVQVEAGFAGEDLVKAIKDHLVFLNQFAYTLAERMKEKSVDPLMDNGAEVLDQLVNSLNHFRNTEINLTYELGANADIGMEGMVTVGAGAGVQVSTNPELILALVGLGHDDYTGSGSFSIDLSLTAEGGVSFGEFAEVTVTGGGGYSTNLLSVEVTETEFSDENPVPLIYESWVPQYNANLGYLNVMAKVGQEWRIVSPNPAFNYGTLSYDIWVPHGTTEVRLYTDTMRPPQEASDWARVYIGDDTEGQQQTIMPYVVDLSNANTARVNIFTFHVTAGSKTYTININKCPSTDLQSLGDGSLSFNPKTYSYTKNLAPGAGSYTITPVLADPANTKMTINGVSWTSGTLRTMTTAASESWVNIKVVPKNPKTPAGLQESLYTIRVRRPPSNNANLSSIEVSGLPDAIQGFNPNTTSYSFAVGEFVSSITIEAESQDPLASVKIGHDGQATMGRASRTVPILPGPNTVNIMVLADDRSTMKTYTLNITRPTTELDQLTLEIGGQTVDLSEVSWYLPNIFEAVSPEGEDGEVEVRLTAVPLTPGAVEVRVNGTLIGVPGSDYPDYVYTETISRTEQTHYVVECRKDSGESLYYVILLNGDGGSVSLKDGTGISIKAGETQLPLVPSFGSGSSWYYAENAGDGTVTVTVDPKDEDVLVLVNGRVAWTYRDGQGKSFPVEVALGPDVTRITFEVVNSGSPIPDVELVGVYSVDVHRGVYGDHDPRPATLSVQDTWDHELLTGFNPDTYSYTIDVPNNCLDVWFRATMYQPGARAYIEAVTWKQFSRDQRVDTSEVRAFLAPGPNVFVIKTNSPSWMFSRTYTVTVNRAKSSDAGLFNDYGQPNPRYHGLAIRTIDELGQIVDADGSGPLPAEGLIPGYNTNKTEYTLALPATIRTLGVKAIPTEAVSWDSQYGYLPTMTINGVPTPHDKWVDIALQEGINTVTITVTAPDGVTTKTYTVTVYSQDNDPPVLTLPENMTVEATHYETVGAEGPKPGATVSFTVSAVDAVDGAVTVTCDPPSGSFFPIGTTTVTCKAKDQFDNEATGTFYVTVENTTPPVIQVNEALLTVEATSLDGAQFDFTVALSVTDLGEEVADENVTFTVAPGTTIAPGSLFPIGETQVTCTAEDAFGNEATQNFTVTVTPLRVISSIAPVTGASVAFGTSELGAIQALPSTTTILDSYGQTHTVTLSWTISGYDSRATGTYDAVATFSLPQGVHQTYPDETPLEVTATVTVLPASGAALNPATVTYDVEAPDDVETVITWHDATSVTGVTCGSVTADPSTDYTIEAIDSATSKLTLSKDFIASLRPTYGTDLEITVSFDVGADAVLTVEIVDTVPPTWEDAILIASSVTDRQVTLIWSPARDASGVTSYKIFADGELIGTSATRQYTVSGLTPNTAYTVKVEAGDAAGNWSNDGPSLSVTTTTEPEEDEDDDTPYTPPTTPTSGSEKTDKLVVEGGAPGVNVDVKYNTAAGTATTRIDDETLKKILEAARSSGGDDTGDEGPAVATVRIPEVDGVTTYTIGLDASSLSSAEGDSQLVVETGIGSVGLSSNMLAGTSHEGEGEVSVTMGLADKETLPEDVKAAVGDRPVVSLTFEVDGEQQE